jgi:DNA-binding response OmpR family regulator
VVSFESCAKAVWGNECDEKFSLYALAKIVENLRKKIYASGINNDILKTVRKKGYLLLN